jgi:hypothetical protein
MVEQNEWNTIDELTDDEAGSLSIQGSSQPMVEANRLDWITDAGFYSDVALFYMLSSYWSLRHKYQDSWTAEDDEQEFINEIWLKNLGGL